MGDKKDKTRSGRFTSGLDPDMEKLSFSLHYDKVLLSADLEGSIAHANALKEAGVLTALERKSIVTALKVVAADVKRGKNVFKPSDEDIHMAVERILTERLGDLGKKLHTGRSRNDQVATDMRLYLRAAADDLMSKIVGLQQALLSRSEKSLSVILPGYTHLQQGQPIYLSHYLLSFFWALERDRQRMEDFLSRIQKCPLGSGALAGTGFVYNRDAVAKNLGFKGPTENSIDATAHRDFVLEFLSVAALCGNLLSRYAEDLVIWSSREFGFIQLHDAFSTGSSMMPQKKNPDSMELIRGKSGRLLGNFAGLFTAVKGTPLCYSRDLQEDKEPVFDTVDTLGVCLAVMAKAVRTLKVFPGVMEKSLDPGLLATDLADYLVEAGLPFREAHKMVGSMVREAESKKISFLDLPDSAWAEFPGGTKIKSKLTYTASCEKRLSGGTALKSVAKQLADARRVLKNLGR